MSRTRRRRSPAHEPAGPKPATGAHAAARTAHPVAVRVPARSSRGPTARRATRTSDPRLLLGVGGLLVVAAAAAAVFLSGPAAGDGTTPSTSPGPAATITAGMPLPAFVATAGDRAVGQPIPEVAGVSFDGTPVRIAADGRPKILLFLAHWCPHCQREVPVVRDWLEAGGLPSGVDLISIATSSDPGLPNYPPDAWLAREAWQPPVLVDADDTVAGRYGLGAFPFWVVASADGTVALRLTGELSPAQLDALVETVVE